MLLELLPTKATLNSHAQHLQQQQSNQSVSICAALLAEYKQPHAAGCLLQHAKLQQYGEAFPKACLGTLLHLLHGVITLVQPARTMSTAPACSSGITASTPVLTASATAAFMPHALMSAAKAPADTAAAAGLPSESRKGSICKRTGRGPPRHEQAAR
jgi:hypothetical protein